jgi:superfamily I DNA/RNA helicase
VTRERLLAASAERKTSVFRVMHHTDVLASFQTRTREAIQAFTAFVDRVREPLGGEHPISLESWAQQWLEETGYLEDLRRQEKDPEVAENRVKNLREMLTDLDGPVPPDPAASARPTLPATTGAPETASMPTWPT